MSDEPPNQPVHGDPQVLPKGLIVRPSGERMPFGPSGELLSSGPALPADFLDVSDVEKFDWKRDRGQEWTDAAFRALILAWVVTFFEDHDWARSWAIVERTHTPSRPGRLKFPILIFKITDFDLATHEVSQEFPESDRTGSNLTARLAQVTTTLEALHP